MAQMEKWEIKEQMKSKTSKEDDELLQLLAIFEKQQNSEKSSTPSQKSTRRRLYTHNDISVSSSSTKNVLPAQQRYDLGIINDG